MKNQSNPLLRYRLVAAATLSIMISLGMSGCGQQTEEAAAPDADATAGKMESAMNAANEQAEQLANDAAEMTDEAIIAAQSKTYPLTVCVVSGEKLGSMGDAINHVHEGRLVKFCCSDCVDEFKSDPAKYLAKLEAAPTN